MSWVKTIDLTAFSAPLLPFTLPPETTESTPLNEAVKRAFAGAGSLSQADPNYAERGGGCRD